jgi:nucleotide-binding universal stress UspA family protein
VRFLLATDGSPGAVVAEDFLLSLPLSEADDVTVLTTPTVSERESYALLSRVHWRFAARHIPVSTMSRHGAASDVIDAVALERAIDVVVLGSRGRGQWSGTLLGSVSRAVARTAPASVLVARAQREAPRRVLLAIDASEDARAAIRLMESMPLPASVPVELLRLAHNGDETQAEMILTRARVVLGTRLARVRAAEWDHAGESVLRGAIAAQADLIVLGAHGQTMGMGLMKASVADHVLSHAHCGTLIAKPMFCARMLAAPAFANVALA